MTEFDKCGMADCGWYMHGHDCYPCNHCSYNKHIDNNVTFTCMFDPSAEIVMHANMQEYVWDVLKNVDTDFQIPLDNLVQLKYKLEDASIMCDSTGLVDLNNISVINPSILWSELGTDSSTKKIPIEYIDYVPPTLTINNTSMEANEDNVIDLGVNYAQLDVSNTFTAQQDFTSASIGTPYLGYTTMINDLYLNGHNINGCNYLNVSSINFEEVSLNQKNNTMTTKLSSLYDIAYAIRYIYTKMGWI